MAFSFQVAYLSGGALRFRRSLFNKIRDRSWLRYVDGVTSLDLNDRSTRALGHGTLRVRWNHLVLGGDQVPARLGPPRGGGMGRRCKTRKDGPPEGIFRNYGAASRRFFNRMNSLTGFATVFLVIFFFLSLQ